MTFVSALNPPASALECAQAFFLSLCITDFSDRISKTRRVGYESGEFEIVSTLYPPFVDA